MNKFNAKSYWYLDEHGINSLLSQCNDYMKKEIKIENLTNSERNKGFKFSIGSISAIFASLSADADISHKQSSGRREILTLQKSDEQKLNDLIENLTSLKQLKIFESQDDFITISNKDLPLFCIASLKFKIDKEFYLKDISHPKKITEAEIFPLKIMERIAEEKFIVLNVIYSGQRDWKKITLGGSLRKWESVRVDENGIPSFGRTSHLFFLLSGAVDSTIELSFFGSVTKINDGLYIKPYAIWNIR